MYMYKLMFRCYGCMDGIGSAGHWGNECCCATDASHVTEPSVNEICC